MRKSLVSLSLAYPPCFCFALSPRYSSLCLLLIGKWLVLSCVTGHRPAKHMSLKASRTTLMVSLGLGEMRGPWAFLPPRQCVSQGMPLLPLSSTDTSMSRSHILHCRAHTSSFLLDPALSSPRIWRTSVDCPVLSCSVQAFPGSVLLSVCHARAYVSWHNMLSVSHCPHPLI